MAETAAGCARPTGAKVGEKQPENTQTDTKRKEEEVRMEMAKVGYKAPDFEAPSYYQGTFSSIKLSDYLGKWVLVCFYPGDFTFV